MRCIKHGINEGVHIESNGLSIDIIVIAIGKKLSYREACLEISGIEGLDKMCLFPSKKLSSLGHDIYIGMLAEKATEDQIAKRLRNISYKKDGLKVKIFYDNRFLTKKESKK